MLKNYKDTLETLSDKLKNEETRTIILDDCLEEMDDIIENLSVCRDFASTLQSDIARYNEYRKEFLKSKRTFEFVTLNDSQKKAKKGPDSICSYKYKKKGKNNKNIRCIYITDEKTGWNIFLKCFVEKDNKGKRGDYRVAIDEAIKRYNEIYGED
ncbi:MAG: hypothetical protein K6B70_05665 [Clostridia bacterium]|nr:hypothetical protein [Clostridia bacterium]